MASRLTTNQEIAGSTPAVVKVVAPFLLVGGKLFSFTLSQKSLTQSSANNCNSTYYSKYNSRKVGNGL